MRFLYILLLSGLLTACASSKSAKQTTQYTPRPQTRSSTSSPTPNTALASKTDEWRVTSVKSKFLAIDTTVVRVYLNLTTQQPNGQPAPAASFTDHFIINYVMYPDYNNRDRLAYGNVPLTAQSVTREQTGGADDHLVVFFDVKRPANTANALLLTEITETSTGKKALNDLQIRFQAAKLTDRFTLFDKKGQHPQLHNYISVNDTAVIRDVTGTAKKLYVYRYQHEFDPATSPMNLVARPAAKSLSIDSTFTVMSNQPIQLPREGLYFFQEDTTQSFGLGLLVTDTRFPRMTRPEKLVKPVLYVSTSQEVNDLNNAKDLKKGLDRYWLGLMAGNEDVARRTIRTFYKHVEEANRLFTSYKEGWKTDKGMIFVILGSPDRVQRSRDREVWVYNRRGNISEINFTFNRKPNQFVEDHYELVRYDEYKSVWYPIVEAWRTGAIRE